jgi:hypothetical protein
LIKIVDCEVPDQGASRFDIWGRHVLHRSQLLVAASSLGKRAEASPLTSFVGTLIPSIKVGQHDNPA